MNLADSERSSAARDEGPSGIVVRAYTSVGTVQSIGTIEVEARELVLLDAKRVNHFIRISITEPGDYARTGAAIFTDEHVDQLAAAIKRLLAVSINKSRFDFTEVEAVVGDLKLTVFNNARNHLQLAVSAEDVTVHLEPVTRLHDLRMLVEKAKRILDDNKPMRSAPSPA